MVKASWFGVRPKAIWSYALKVRKGTVASGWTKSHAAPVPELSILVTGKSSWGRRGLIIETATGIHPGFTGCLTLEFANVGSTPIELSPGMQACQIFFHNVKGDEEGAVTQFVGFRKPGLGKVERDATLVALGKSYFPA
jgi:hypothetical protein